MKVIAYSNWQRPIVKTVKNRRQANRLVKTYKHEQLLTDILTEREYAGK